MENELKKALDDLFAKAGRKSGSTKDTIIDDFIGAVEHMIEQIEDDGQTIEDAKAVIPVYQLVILREALIEQRGKPETKWVEVTRIEAVEAHMAKKRVQYRRPEAGSEWADIPAVFWDDRNMLFRIEK